MVTSKRHSVAQQNVSSSSTSQRSSQAVAFVRLKVEYLNFAKLTALSETLAIFRQKVQESMVSWANLSVAPQQIRLEFKPGSVLVDASIIDLSPAQIEKWTSEVNPLTFQHEISLKAKLEASISGIAGIHSACTGPIAISDIKAGTEKTPQDSPSMTSIMMAAAFILVNTVFILSMLLLARSLVGTGSVLSLCNAQAEAEDRVLQPTDVSVEAFRGPREQPGQGQPLSRWRGGLGDQRIKDQRILIQRNPKKQGQTVPTRSALCTIFESEAEATPSVAPLESANPSASGDNFALRARALGFSDKIAREVLEECGGNKDRALAMLAAA